MPRLRLWLHYFRSLLLALRIIAFEQTERSVLAVWAGPALLVVLVLFMHSVSSGLGASAVMLLVFVVMRIWARKNRYRLVRTADRVEYADVGTEADGYRQRFESGVVLQRLDLEAAKRTGTFDTDLMEGSDWFFLVRSPDRTRIVPFDWIVSIDIDEAQGEN